jgi:hypothetical protein
LLKAVFDGAKFENGKRVKESKTTKGQAAA